MQTSAEGVQMESELVGYLAIARRVIIVLCSFTGGSGNETAVDAISEK